MSEAKKYDRRYKEQSVKLALETGVKRARNELKYWNAVWVRAGGSFFRREPSEIDKQE